MTQLILYTDQKAEAVALIKGFWLAHNHYRQSDEEAEADLAAWTAEGHRLYLISQDGQNVGLLHLGSRGVEIDWLEDLFVLPACQRQGIGTAAVRLAEEIVKGYSTSMYIEAAARNEAAIRLYRRLGYDCLNTVTVRKDFQGYEYRVLRTESVWENSFEIRADQI